MPDKPIAAPQAFGKHRPALAACSDDVLFGDVQERPGLSKRDRSFITVACLVALYRTNELPFSFEAGARVRRSGAELIELITPLEFYSDGRPQTVLCRSHTQL